MPPSDSVFSPEPISAPRRVLQFISFNVDSDVLVMVGLPLLIVVGAILGLINLLSWIHLIAVLLNG